MSRSHQKVHGTIKQNYAVPAGFNNKEYELEINVDAEPITQGQGNSCWFFIVHVPQLCGRIGNEVFNKLLSLNQQL